MTEETPGKINIAQKCILAFSFMLPALTWAFWPWQAVERLLPGLTEHQHELISRGCYFGILLATCLFNTWSMAMVAEIAPEKRRLQITLLGALFLILQLLATFLMFPLSNH